MIDNQILNNQISSVLKKGILNGNIQNLTSVDIPLISQIASNFKLSTQTDKNAEMLFVAAPTGAGKDTLVRKLTSQNPNKNYVVLNMDMFRHYYQNISKQINEINDKDFAQKTNDISYEIYYLIEELILNYYQGTNVILTGTMKDTPWIESILRKYKNNKYDVNLSVLTVPYQESAFSIFERYLNIVETQLNSKTHDTSSIRYTDLKYHDETFNNFSKSLEYFENSNNLLSSISVYRRDKNINDFSEDTLIFSSNSPSNFKESTATATANSILYAPNIIDPERMSNLLELISKNENYLKEQGLFTEIGKSLNYIHSLDNKPFSKPSKRKEDIDFEL